MYQIQPHEGISNLSPNDKLNAAISASISVATSAVLENILHKVLNEKQIENKNIPNETTNAGNIESTEKSSAIPIETTCLNADAFDKQHRFAESPESINKAKASCSSEHRYEPIHNYDNDGNNIDNVGALQSSDAIRTLKKLNTVERNHLTQNIQHYLTHSTHFVTRICLLIFCTVLLLLSSCYAISSISSTQLDLLTPCDGKDIYDIWQHSATYGLQHGQDHGCMTTRSLEIDSDSLWFTNQYKHKFVYGRFRICQCILFCVVTSGCFCIIIYHSLLLIADIISIKNQTLFKKSQQYDLDDKEDKDDAKRCSLVSTMYDIYDTYFKVDSNGYIAALFMSEIMETLLQTNALLFYNGLNIFDVSNQRRVYLANKPYFILIFCVLLSMNCFLTGILWLFYTFKQDKCSGNLFKLCIFMVDQCCEFGYTLFPFIVVLYDDYNNSATLWIAFGLLNNSTMIAMISAGVPLLLLCLKCFLMLQTATNEMRNKSYKMWLKISDEVQRHSETGTINKELITKITERESNTGHDIGLKCKQMILALALIFIIYSATLLSFVSTHLIESHDFCHSVQEINYNRIDVINGVYNISDDDIYVLQKHPELFVYDECLYKVYPFSINNDIASHCQCRAIVLEWSEDNTLFSYEEKMQYFNISQYDIINGVFQYWWMLEKFKSVGNERFSDNYNLSETFFKSTEMKAFEWNNMQITAISSEIQKWSQSLEFFKLNRVFKLSSIPSTLSTWNNLKYFEAKQTELTTFPIELCQLRDLQVIDISIGNSIESIPFCITELTKLKQFSMNSCLSLKYIPIEIFNMVSLSELSLWNNAISYDTLMISNKDAVFKWNPYTQIYLSQNLICQQDIDLLSTFSQFIGETNVCDNSHCNNEDDVGLNTVFCPPIIWQDGKCDDQCNFGICSNDGGDCNQLCFTKTDCNYTLFSNSLCDEACNNTLCDYDNSYCLKDTEIEYSSSGCNPNQYIVFDDFAVDCDPSWINDGYCDDSCSTFSECQYDGSDCDQDEQCNEEDCAYFSFAWHSLMSGKHYAAIDVLCESLIPLAKKMGAWDGLSHIHNKNCTKYASTMDLNHDNHIDFREFIAITYQFLYYPDGFNTKAYQFNCSDCVGIDNYHINVNML